MNHNIFRIIVMCFGLIAGAHIHAQKTSWVKYFNGKDMESSRVSLYTGTGDTEEKAKDKVLENVLKENALAVGYWSKVNINSQTGNFVDQNGQELKTKARRIGPVHCEKKDGIYHAYMIVQVARSPFVTPEPLKTDNKYNYIGESFVPGMAQIKKGQTGKGVFFIAAETVCVGGIIVSEAMRSNYISKMNNTREGKLKLSYKNKSNTWATARNIAIAGTAAFYVWNVVDGIVAKGKTHIVGPHGEHIAFSPYYNPESLVSPESSGLAMRVTF